MNPHASNVRCIQCLPTSDVAKTLSFGAAASNSSTTRRDALTSLLRFDINPADFVRKRCGGKSRPCFLEDRASIARAWNLQRPNPYDQIIEKGKPESLGVRNSAVQSVWVDFPAFSDQLVERFDFFESTFCGRLDHYA